MDSKSSILLVIVENKISASTADREAQVIAEAIATFRVNNERRNLIGLDTLDEMTVPCITMSGTHPTFYLVPVTRALSDAVFAGAFPTTRTWVSRCATPPPHPDIGMEDPWYRKLVLKRFISFREIARPHWSRFLR